MASAVFQPSGLQSFLDWEEGQELRYAFDGVGFSPEVPDGHPEQ